MSSFAYIRGELDKSPTAMFNLYRASQVSFPREKIIEEAKSFTYKFLSNLDLGQMGKNI